MIFCATCGRQILVYAGQSHIAVDNGQRIVYYCNVPCSWARNTRRV